MHLRHPAHPHLHDETLHASHRWLAIAGSAEHVVEYLHLWQPRRIGKGRPNLRPRVAPFGNSTLAVFLCLALGLILAGALELLVEGTLADAAAIIGDVAEPFDLISVEITGEDKTDKVAGGLFLGRLLQCRFGGTSVEITDENKTDKGAESLFLGRLLQCRFGGTGVEPQLIQDATVRKTVNPWGSVRPAHDARLAHAVLNPFKRIGESGAFEASRICQNVGDGAACQVGVIEGKVEIR